MNQPYEDLTIVKGNFRINTAFLRRIRILPNLCNETFFLGVLSKLFDRVIITTKYSRMNQVKFVEDSL